MTEKMTGFDLARTVHNWAQESPFDDGRMVCMRCGYKRLVKDLCKDDEMICGKEMTRKERLEYIQSRKWEGADAYLIRHWLGSGAC